MSIRGFHIIFVIISTLLCAGISFWVFQISQMTEGVAKMVFGGGAAFCAVLLIVYGFYFYNKINKLKI